MLGGSKGPIAKYVDTLFDDNWQETRISADLHVQLHHAKRDELLDEYVREGYLDGHRIDFLNGKVALDLEWNSKDQTYDRDLYGKRGLSAVMIAERDVAGLIEEARAMRSATAQLANSLKQIR
ncbi:BglII/BstYI family type II restriction endonuclease [Paracoccus tegillarcae]|uniref:BglII/BstYI family type II restriction endonuclease n=1 Tax=Paracoccus tegillarcae TaxID=1529068 RepID=UPI0013002E01|nr:BglII/BstYI family type II restriction endonuclease [Paracoccus tegillarcae]